jgi:hypothetical protein
MSDEPDGILPAAQEQSLTEEEIQQALVAFAEARRSRNERFVLAALSSIPCVGGVLAASAALDAEKEQGRVNYLHLQWLQEHRRLLAELARDLMHVIDRVDQLGPAAEERLESDAYLGVVRKGFRVWDGADTREKRDYVRRLIANAAGTKLCSDDVVRLFIEWISYYHEVHFAVIRAIYRSPGSTRYAIWMEMYGERVREDSAEADLFRLVIHDLSTGRVIRQQRERTAGGEFLKKPRRHVPKGYASPVMKSSFDDEDPYELSELGNQFVHYVMTDIVPRIGAGTPRSDG